MILAAHALLETYANLTSAPALSRLPGPRAVEVIQAFVARAGTAALLPSLAGRGVTGEGVHDALIYECARAAGVDVLLTFNARHFLPLETDVRVVIP